MKQRIEPPDPASHQKTEHDRARRALAERVAQLLARDWLASLRSNGGASDATVSAATPAASDLPPTAG